MKTTSLLLTGFIALLIAANAHAMRWYTSSSGRWLSRDPIEEAGGNSLYEFVSNTPVVTIDGLGLIGMGDAKMHCCHLVWNNNTHCCDNGYIVARSEKRPTGVVTHIWRQNPNGAGPVHHWLTWDGGSADSNGDALIFPPGSRKISSPAQATPAPTSSDDPLLLSPCEYDFKKLNACLSDKARNENGRYGGMCWDLPPRYKDDCMNQAKK